MQFYLNLKITERQRFIPISFWCVLWQTAFVCATSSLTELVILPNTASIGHLAHCNLPVSFAQQFDVKHFHLINTSKFTRLRPKKIYIKIKMISDDSGVKFFDRKFVAANLRSQLRCPKCDHEYSHRHTAGSGAGK